MDIIKGVIDKVASRKLAVTAAAGAATAGTGIVELTWPQPQPQRLAAVCCCYLLSQALVDSRA